MATYSICDLDRRELLAMVATISASFLLRPTLASGDALPRTGQILGPFYPVAPMPATSDLTRVQVDPAALRDRSYYKRHGQGAECFGRPSPQCRGRDLASEHLRTVYASSDPNPAPLDPIFEGSAVLRTDSEGRYRFKTIKPAAYPAGPSLMRPAHIHFQVTGREDRGTYWENAPCPPGSRLGARGALQHAWSQRPPPERGLACRPVRHAPGARWPSRRPRPGGAPRASRDRT
jgi:protocatechuate 3,4-dioxygenase beta subunit